MFKSNLILTVIAIIILVIIAIPSQFLFNKPEFQQQLTAHIPSGFNGVLLLGMLLTLLTSIGLPRQIAAFMSGYCFNFSLGVIVATVAATLGCWLTFSFAKYFLPRFVDQRFPTQQQAIIAFLKDELFYKAIIIRILPIGSNFLTNIIAGACRLNGRSFITGSFIGFIPQMVIFSLAGTGVKLASSSHLLFSAGLFIIASILSYWLYNRGKKREQCNKQQ